MCKQQFVQRWVPFIKHLTCFHDLPGWIVENSQDFMWYDLFNYMPLCRHCIKKIPLPDVTGPLINEQLCVSPDKELKDILCFLLGFFLLGNYFNNLKDARLHLTHLIDLRWSVAKEKVYPNLDPIKPLPNKFVCVALTHIKIYKIDLMRCGFVSTGPQRAQ